MKTFIALCAVWVVLALTTLDLVVHNNSSLFAALVAWLGGLITYRLGQSVYRYYYETNTPA